MRGVVWRCARGGGGEQKQKQTGLGTERVVLNLSPFHFELSNLLDLQFPPRLSRNRFLTEFTLQLNQITQVKVPGT